MKPNKFFSAIFIVFGVLLLIPLQAQRATLPYNQNFSDCSDTDYWEMDFLSGNGSICFCCYDGLSITTCCINNDESIGYGDLLLDLSQSSNIKIDFEWQWYSIGGSCWNQTYAEVNSGVFLSDDNGSSFTKVHTFTDGVSQTWFDVSLDISQLATQHGLNTNNQFVIRFQSYSMYSVSPNCLRDILIDNVNVYSDCPTNMSITTDISGGNYEFLASEQITASNEISNGATVHYGANSSVKLQTGFKVNSGVSFVADLDGCNSTATLKSTNLSNNEEDVEGLINYNENMVRIYPNPSQGLFNINVTNESKLTILNSFGTIVYKDILQVGENKVDLSHCNKGLFIVVVDDGNIKITEKVLIE